MRGTYRPAPEDFFVDSKRTPLSLSQSGEFDRKYQVYEGGKLVDRTPTTMWTVISRQRAARGISRRARIAQRKEAA